MGIKVRQHGNVTILELWGRLILGEGSDELRSYFQELLEAGERFFLLDCLTSFKYMDSAGVRAILNCHEAALCQGATIKLVLNRHINHMPSQRPFWLDLEVYFSLDSALASFSQD